MAKNLKIIVKPENTTFGLENGVFMVGFDYY